MNQEKKSIECYNYLSNLDYHNQWKNKRKTYEPRKKYRICYNLFGNLGYNYQCNIKLFVKISCRKTEYI